MGNKGKVCGLENRRNAAEFLILTFDYCSINDLFYASGICLKLMVLRKLPTLQIWTEEKGFELGRNFLCSCYSTETYCINMPTLTLSAQICETF